MRFLVLELKGYRRLALNNINFIRLTPTSKIQMILGTNGSGKSSLMKEISPMPAIPAEFHKGGYKYVEIVHNNSVYKLKSSFGPEGNKFSFIKDDGEELNPGGTVTVYKELVKREFNITQEVQDLLTGNTLFSRMSVAERRGWFTRISDADYTYAIQYYQRLRDQHRDLQGAIKLNQSRLVQESEKLLSPEDEQKYREEVTYLNQFLGRLLEMKTPLHSTRSQVEQELADFEKRLGQAAESCFQYRRQFLNVEGYTSPEEIEQHLIDTQTAIQVHQHRFNELCRLIETEQQSIDVLQKNNIASSNDIDRVIKEKLEQYDQVSKHLNHNLKFDDSQQALQTLLSVTGHLTDMAISIEENADRKYSRDEYARLVQREKDLSLLIQNKSREYDGLVLKQKELEYHKDHDKTECPQCQFVWSKGYNEKIYRETVERVSQLYQLVESYKKEQVAVQEALEKTKTYLEQYRSYAMTVKGSPVLEPLWTFINENNIIFERPRYLPGLLEAVKTDLQLQLRMEEIQKQLKENLDLKELLSRNQELDLSKLKISIEGLHKELEGLTTALRDEKVTLGRLNLYRQVNGRLNAITTDIEHLEEVHEQKKQELLHHIRREALNETIQVIQLELNKREQVLSKVNIQKALVASLESQLKELVEKAEVLKLAVKELSPTEGLIAKGLSGFINHFVQQVNSFIKKIWLYPLELIPVVPDENDGVDLDYKFEVRINDDVVIPDVAKASSAQMEVIDLGFKLVSMQYLKLNEAPIYLDEFGKAMDHSHRQSAFYVITNLITSANFSQIFMISHYEQSYGSLKNTDITVLCPSNVVLPKDLAFNTAVVIQ